MLDILVIGSGPAGLSAAVYAKRNNLNTMIIEKDYLGSGRIAYGVRVDNYLGLPGMSGFDLGEKFRAHAEDLDVPFCHGEVTQIRRCFGGWKVSLYGGESLEAQTLIYAAGTRQRMLGVEGEKEFLGKGVSFCVLCDGHFYKDKAVAVVGGGDNALDSALYLTGLCPKVYLIHWRRYFRGNEATLARLEQSDKVEILRNLSIRRLSGEGRLQTIHLSDGSRIGAEGLFEAVGSLPNTDLVKDFVMLDREGYVIAGEDCTTMAEGMFVAGDVRTKQLRQVSTAVADGANAAWSAMRYLKNKI